ncbi:MAG TPA: glycosyltransferase family 39 protein [Blastocatellia bacterium]|nr:glycosyltransferase family 39 protein [Blastocatellia bacterium]
MNQDPDFFGGLLLFLVFLLAGIGILYLTKNHRSTMRFQVKLFLCACGLRFLMSVIIYQFGLVSVLKDEDASGWIMGQALYNDWVRKHLGLFQLPAALAEAFSSQHKGYGFMVGALFYFTDSPGRLSAAALNCLIGALTVVLVYRIARSLFSESVAVRSGWWACLMPSMLIWSAQTLKEPTIILLETVVLYGCVRLKLSGFSLRHIIACALAIVLVLPFRFYAAYIAGAAIAVALVMPQFGKRKMGVLPALGIAACLIPIITMSGIFVQSEAQIERFDLQRIQKFREGISVGTGSGVTNTYDLKTPGGLGMATLVGGTYLLLAPFPWQLGGGSVRMALTAPELVVWWWLFFVGVLPGMWYLVRNRFGDVQPLLFFLFGLGLLYSMMFGNVGLAYRQRAQLMPWLLIFAMVGLEQRALKRARRKESKSAAREPRSFPRPTPAT